MTTLDAIFSRKSVRSFCGPLTDAELNTVLQAAYAAPVGRALYENVHLTVITNRELIGKLNEAAIAFFGNPNMDPLHDAPVFVLVSAKLGSPADNVGYSNCATIVENMALAAVELGLGACHIWGAVAALNQNPALVDELNLPEGFTPCCGIIMGKTEEEYTPCEPISERIATAYLR